MLCDDDNNGGGGSDNDDKSNFSRVYQWYDVKTKFYKNVLNFLLFTGFW